MKSIFQGFFTILLTFGISFGQPINISITPTLINTTSYDFVTGSGDPYVNWVYSTDGKIGYLTAQYSGGVTVKSTYRSLYKINLSSIPADAIITSAKLESWVTDFSLNYDNFRAETWLTPSTVNDIMSSDANPSDEIMEQRFNSVSGATKTSSQKYNDTIQTEMTTLTNGRRSTGFLIFLGASNVEYYDNSMANLHIKLNVTYVPPFQVTFKNNFPGGTMNISLNGSSIPSPSLPYIIPGVKEGDALTVGAVTQTDDMGFERVWNDYAPVVPSDWKKEKLGVPAIAVSNSAIYNFTAGVSDIEATYGANMRRNYRISRNDLTEFGATISAGIVGHVIESNDGTVSAPLQQTIGGISYSFVSWSDGDRTNPRSIVNAQSDLAFTAFYKAHLLSSSQSATSSNGQRKIASVGVVKHAVYESAGSIWYTQNDANNPGWTPEKLIALSMTATNPSIAVTHSPEIVHVVWEEVSPYEPVFQRYYHTVHYTRSTDYGNSWSPSIFITLDEPSAYCTYNTDARPVIEGYTAPVVVVWKYGSSVSGGLAMQADPSNNSIQYSLTGSFATPTPMQPSLTYGWRPDGTEAFNLAYTSSTGGIWFKEFQVESSAPYSPSNIVTMQLSTSSTCANPTVEAGAASATGFHLVSVAWDDLSAGNRHIFYCQRNKFATTFASIVEFTHGTDQETKPMIGIDGGLDAIFMLWECGTHIAQIQRPMSSTTWSGVANLGQGYSPNLTHWGGSGTFHWREWTTGTSQPYSIVITSAEPPAIPTLSWVPYNTHPKLNWTSSGSNITYNLYRYFCTFGDPDCNLSGSLIYTGNAYTFTDNSVQVWIHSTENDPASTAYYYVTATNLQNFTSARSEKAIVNTANIVWKSGIGNYEEESPIAEIPKDTKLFASYPNPFNPTTKFEYQMVQPGHVSLIIYNTLGQEMARLAEGTREIGRYSEVWNAGMAPSGLYYARMIIADLSGNQVYRNTQKVLLIK